MVEKGDIWYLYILGGRVHFKRISIPGRKYRNGPIFVDLIPFLIIIPDDELTIKYYKGFIEQHGLFSEGNKDVGPGV